ncbi:hypothetical protein [Lysinibacillus endophyticus]|uniref:hypothetical protein n=1 Tax=Ureibacillus endophyticus TaxID=1978490 RepID=UPI00209FF6E7|nr:hypothetical protein [Lysinibacillus endophyticus]MCP1145800.1 hypothetical protein [Lysinibacillus endophyticus]
MKTNYQPMQMKFIKEEQETYVNLDPIDDIWTIYSATPTLINKYIKKAIAMNIDYKVLTEFEGKPTSIEIKVPGSLFNNTFLREKRAISEEHKKALANGRNARRLKEAY